MPGVPSSKGCDACAKQKKKCDQLKPACSRCKRLRIPCVGSGKQRYKFMTVMGGPDLAETTRSKPAPSHEKALIRVPSNQASAVLSDFINKLEVKDLRYDICWSYGQILKEVPRRLGANAALDASVSALTTALSDIDGCHSSPVALTRFGNALRALKSCLDDPQTAQSSNTLCAIYLIWICQTWIGRESHTSRGHGAGIVQILSTAPYRHTKDEFEQLLLITIAPPVIFESLYDPTVQLNPWVKQFVMNVAKPFDGSDSDSESGDSSGEAQEGRIMTCIVRLPDFFKYNPALVPDILVNYKGVQASTRRVHEKMAESAALVKQKVPFVSIGPAKIRATPPRLYAFYHRTYALFLSIEILLNGILRAYCPEDLILERESYYLSESLINLSLQASTWKPLGAGWIPICLESAWASTTDTLRKKQIEKAWIDCWGDVGGHQMEVAAHESSTAFGLLRKAAAAYNSPPPLPGENGILVTPT